MPIYSSKIGISVVDNVLLVHQVDAKVVILYDIFADSRAPISAPLPLLLRRFPRSNSSGFRAHREDNESSEAYIVNDYEINIYGDEWTFLVPDLICDVANQFLWKIQLDLDASSFIAFGFSFFLRCMVFLIATNASLFLLQAISASSSDVPSVLEFLQRRKLDASKVDHLFILVLDWLQEFFSTQN